MMFNLKNLLFVLLIFSSAAFAQQPTSPNRISVFEEQRYCGAPARTESGTIKRRSDVLTAFRKEHPCPVTGKSTGSCPNWQIDHVIPLVCGGCDSVSNLQWLPVEIKTCKGIFCKDRFEQKIYCKSK